MARRAASARRRRWWWLGGALLVSFVFVATILWLAGRGGEGSTDASDLHAAAVVPGTDAPAASTAGSTIGSTAAPPGTTGGPLRPVRLDEVWLIDRGDGSYEWGSVISSRVPDDRGPVVITASFLGDDGTEVAQADERLRSLAGGADATVGGIVDDPDGIPQSLAVDVMVGDDVDGPTPHPDDLRILAVERRGGRGSDGFPDVVVGRIRSSLDTDVVGIRLALVWRDDRGQVAAAVFHDVERVRPGVDARFEVPVDDRLGVDGPPVEVSWTH
jgi:hypothetical protein